MMHHIIQNKDALAAFALLGGIIWRVRGGLWSGLGSKEIWRAVFTLPFMYAVIFFSHRHYHISEISLLMLIGICAFGVTFGAISTGYANFQDMGTWKGTDHPPNWLEKIIFPLKPHMSKYWYDFLGMTLSGLIVTLPAGLATMNPVLALIGCFKSVAYATGWKIYPNGTGRGITGFNQATEIGEFLSGIIFWGAVWSSL